MKDSERDCAACKENLRDTDIDDWKLCPKCAKFSRFELFILRALEGIAHAAYFGGGQQELRDDKTAGLALQMRLL